MGPPDSTTVIAPLRMVAKAGTLYVRLPEVTSTIKELLCLPLDEQAARCEIADESHRDFVRLECVVYLVRSLRGAPASVGFERLYKALLSRFALRLPRAEYPLAVKMKEQDLREAVLDRFIKLLVLDRTEYQVRLDYFEVRFDAARLRLLQSAFKTEGRRTEHHQALGSEPDGTMPEEVESAASAARESSFPELNLSEDCRVKLEAAIDSLPQAEQTVIQLVRKGFPFTSADPSAISISMLLNKHEKTVRNMRDRAVAKLQTAMSEGGCL